MGGEKRVTDSRPEMIPRYYLLAVSKLLDTSVDSGLLAETAEPDAIAHARGYRL